MSTRFREATPFTSVIYRYVPCYQIPIQLREIFIKGINDGASMKVVPTKSMSATLSEKKGVIVLGDAFNMRHPLIASGMMVV
ncbi:PREDICTED: squalene monooxygenase 1,1-like [Brassica oleracea var. oleracea]|uniref:squalene monooxygenase 1,1-like n=1 Tax=Brassica oleracea var. oleracea TaxID=109376 RepID=UPI0006A70B58|nr:PREDICTED: squalene monooxygenase 1,1-like [Brassica oleracea var. oleracea]